MTAPLSSLSVQQLTEQLEQLLAKATPQPWHFEMDTEAVPHIVAGNRYVCGPADEYADTELIFAAVKRLPTLLATIRRLQAACDAKQAVIDAVTELAAEYERNAADEARFSVERTRQENVYAAVLCSGMAAGWDHAASRLRTALASPDTAQEA